MSRLPARLLRRPASDRSRTKKLHYHRRLRLEPLEDRRVLAPFSPGSIVAYRAGTLNSQLTNAAVPVFIDEFAPGGTLLQSLALPTSTSGNQRRLTAAGPALGAPTTEGLLTRSADGRYLLLAGYDAALNASNPAGSASSSTARIVGRIDALGAIDTSTIIADGYNNTPIRGVASADGTTLWTSGGNGGNSGGLRS